MFVDVAISGILAALTILMAYLGVHVTLHPPTESPRRARQYKQGFCLCAALSVCLVVWQGIRNATSERGMESDLRSLRNQIAHTHFRFTIGSFATRDVSLIGKQGTLREILPKAKKAAFNVTYVNSGSSDSQNTGATGELFVSSIRPNLDTSFSALQRGFKAGWTGDQLAPQESKFFTAESHILSKEEIAGIADGTMGLFLIAIVRYSDTTGEYEQQFCNTIQPPGSFSVWHGCGEHESEIKIK